MQVGLVVYTALDYNLQADEECLISHDLEQLISHMTVEGELFKTVVSERLA